MSAKHPHQTENEISTVQLFEIFANKMTQKYLYSFKIMSMSYFLMEVGLLQFGIILRFK